MRQEKPHKKKSFQTRLVVKNEAELMNFLLEKMGGMSRTSVKSLLAHRQVQVDGRIETQYNFLLQPAQVVTISTAKAGQELKHPKLRVVYEDDYLLVVEKQPGLLTVATAPESRETTVFSILKTYVRRTNPRAGIYVVHRLDRETSGLLVFAKNSELQNFMRENWRQIVSKRFYAALVEGAVEKPKDTVISWLTENPRTTRVYSSFTDNGGKKSISHYEKLSGNENFSLLKLRLETGRTNQIRVQMSAIGHPVVGDRKYGSGASPILDRLALHAYVLEFSHPVTREKMSFETPIPRGFTKVFQRPSQS